MKRYRIVVAIADIMDRYYSEEYTDCSIEEVVRKMHQTSKYLSAPSAIWVEEFVRGRWWAE